MNLRGSELAGRDLRHFPIHLPHFTMKKLRFREGKVVVKVALLYHR